MNRFVFFTLFFILLATLPHSVAAAQPPPFSLTYNDQIFVVSVEELLNWHTPSTITENPGFQITNPSAEALIRESLGEGQQANVDTGQYSYNANQIYAYIRSLADTINSPATEPALVIKNNRASSFTPPQNGNFLDVLQSTKTALAALQRGEKTAELSVSSSTPKTSLESLNTLGINELIAEGVSSFKGSPQNRRYNIKVGVDKMRGVIVPKGAVFSFNENLGPVDGEHGFLPELVIKTNETVPEFGGGLCQVSSTTFRAAMAAGLPITERRNHSYAVQYYAPQGTDATIYPGSADLKFINDTPGAMLIWPYQKDKDTLIFDFYGTKDDRQVILEKPVVYDKKTDGSMKATWTRIVTKDGKTKTDVFKSTYLPPALFHKQETFVTGTATPESLHVGIPQPQ